MSERALRGTRLVVTSYETDRGIDLAPRQAVEYACQNGHRFEMPFSVEAEIPPEWECKACGAQALLVDGDGPEEKKGRVVGGGEQLTCGTGLLAGRGQRAGGQCLQS
ncbi:RNA polymerase-binding protein RbpA, partial [Streptomyces microflavus]|uniref:RNA polymerase-binding protein RbpA n=1 Tax=Streptomyces microflavus TaxID=1919 RepID=UPI0033B37361